METLYEDNHLIIINKRPSDIVQGDKTGDEPLSESLKQYLKEKYNKTGNVYLGVVHRLDRPASGALIFAKTDKALSRMNELLKTRDIRKYYWAITKNAPPKPEDHLEHYLIRNEKLNKSFVYEKEGEGRKKAELYYKILTSSENYHLLEIELLTGRHHQIRAQLAHIGCPIKGDLKYGAKRSNPDGSISLHARRIEFVHPVKKEPVIVVAPVPDDALWRYFEAQYADK